MGGQEAEKAKKHICAGLLAHVDAGKTTLSEAMLFHGGSIRKMGRVDNGDAFLDTYSLERERGITIFSKQALLRLGDTQVTLLDTPGHVDFSAEMERTLQVLDYAVLVINGADGVQGHTRTLWRLLKRYAIPVFLFVNKMDQPGTDKEALLRQLRERLDKECVDFTREGTQEFYEDIATADERALELFLEEGKVGEEEIRGLIQRREIFPCFFGSALKSTGIREFLEGLYRYMQAPVYGEGFAAKVFKISRDPQGNRLTFLKVTGGKLRARMVLSGRKGSGQWEEKVSQIRIYSGEKYSTAEEAKGGEVCAVTGLTQTYAGEGLGMEEGNFQPVLQPVLTYRLELPEGCDAAMFLPKLRQLEEEEPQLHIVWDGELKEIQAKIMGGVQTQVLGSMIRERFGLEVGFGAGNIVYKETIAGRVEGVGHFEPLRHYAEVHLLMEAGEPGSGLVFCTDCSEDVLDRNWQRLVLTHLEEKEHRGVLIGAPITDMRITLAAGRAHLKHTEGGDFRQATYRALRQGLMEARSVLLEPYYDFRLEVPGNMVGRAMTDLEKFAGVFELAGTEGPMAVLAGKVPAASIGDYHQEVVAYTKGEGKLFCTFRDYEPCHNTLEVMESAGYDPERDTDNPSGSVFCAHGAGFVVEWDRVKEYMHMESVLPQGQDGGTGGGFYATEAGAVRRRRPGKPDGEEAGLWMGTEEVDAILESVSHANRKGRKADGTGRPGWKGKGAGRGAVERDYGNGAGRAGVKEDGGKGAGTAGGAQDGRVSGPDGEKRAGTAGRREDKDKQGKQPEYLLVDGYNIIYAWEELRELAAVNMDGARGKLMDILSNYQGVRGINLIVVFDAYRVQGHDTEILDYYNIHVVYTKEAETADQYIEKFAHENGRRAKVTVATSDGLEQIIIRGEGCILLSARELEEEVKRAGEGLYRAYADRQGRERNYLFDSLAGEAAEQVERLKRGML